MSRHSMTGGPRPVRSPPTPPPPGPKPDMSGRSGPYRLGRVIGSTVGMTVFAVCLLAAAVFVAAVLGAAVALIAWFAHAFLSLLP